jgi:hypothetical protein
MYTSSLHQKHRKSVPLEQSGGGKKTETSRETHRNRSHLIRLPVALRHSAATTETDQTTTEISYETKRIGLKLARSEGIRAHITNWARSQDPRGSRKRAPEESHEKSATSRPAGGERGGIQCLIRGGRGGRSRRESGNCWVECARLRWCEPRPCSLHPRAASEEARSYH